MINLFATTAVVCLLCNPPEGQDVPQTPEKKPNRLIHSLSPYLLQHAHNPVDWYPWGAEALNRARQDNKPIFLSIGYSACHWCHVMEHEVFEQPDVAAILNEHFVSIKVDREERPDLDEIYMQATVAMNNGNGGWPMSVFLTPDCVPFYAGTYFPKETFVQLIEAIHQTWRQDPQRIQETTGQLQRYLRDWAAGSQGGADVPPHDVVLRTAQVLAGAFDLVKGGMRSQGNKFPPSMAMDLMLRAHQATGDDSLLEPVRVTLERMARGGIYDHLGGGICRYSTDEDWLVPHFEKMLYDQALVSGIFLDGYQVFDEPLFAEVARGILDYVIGDLQSPQGGFYSTRDADSEGQEGKYYIWTLEEVQQLLGPQDAAIFCDYYDVSAPGNWTDRLGHAPPGPKNILNVKRGESAVAADHQLSVDTLRSRLDGMRARLRAARAQRVPPGLDDKILSGWNGMMIASLARGARVLDEPRYADAAARAADFVLSRLREQDRLLRTFRQDQAGLTAYLSDYAFMIEGLLNLYEATFESRWLGEARSLADTCRQHYYDTEGGGFFFTAHDAETLIARTKNPNDGAIPSGNSVHAHNLLRLAILFNSEDYKQQAESILRCFAPAVAEAPYRFERLLCALDFYHRHPREIVVVPGRERAAAPLLRCVYRGYLPNKIVAAPGAEGDAVTAHLPLLLNKTAVDGKPTAYVCENYRCRAPVQSAEALAQLLWPVDKKKVSGSP